MKIVPVKIWIISQNVIFIITIKLDPLWMRMYVASIICTELSEVLWSMLFRFGLTFDMAYVGGILLWAVFGAFAVVTVAVLLLMEGLSAFLHTLRLHW